MKIIKKTTPKIIPNVTPKPIIKKLVKATPLQKVRISALENARAEKQLRRESGEVDKRRNPLEVHLDDPKSMRKAINANCYDCCGQENHQKRIKYCNIFDCTFWMLRPYSKNISKEDCLLWAEASVPFKDEDTD